MLVIQRIFDAHVHREFRRELPRELSIQLVEIRSIVRAAERLGVHRRGWEPLGADPLEGRIRAPLALAFIELRGIADLAEAAVLGDKRIFGGVAEDAIRVGVDPSVREANIPTAVHVPIEFRLGRIGKGTPGQVVQVNGTRGLIEVHHELVFEPRGVGIQRQGCLAVVEAELAGEVRADVGGDFGLKAPAIVSPVPLALAGPGAELFHKGVGCSEATTSRDFPRHVFGDAPSGMEARAQHAAKHIVLVIPHAADDTPALFPGPRVLGEYPRNLFLALYAVLEV